jgi:hypothetical protein
MKKLLFLLLIPVLASADNLPDGFEGLRWAQPLAALPQAKKLVETPLYQCYRSGEGIAQVGATSVSNLRLCFSDDRFYFVQMEFAGEKEFAALLGYAKNQWGIPRPVQRTAETYAWGGGEEKIYVELEFSKLDDRGTLAYVYLPIFRETQEAGRRERKNASQ